MDNLAKSAVKKNAERTLKIEIDDEAFDRLYGFESHPVTFVAGDGADCCEGDQPFGR